MIYALSQKTKMEIFIMPAWMPVSDSQDASGDIHVGLIPALHAGKTQSRSCTMTDRGPSGPRNFQRGHEEQEERFLDQGSSNPPLFPPLSKRDERGFLGFPGDPSTELILSTAKRLRTCLAR